ncbi:hypothetical protein [Cellulomonas shaoxiangyii]|uniref:DUF5709 domain-containing protein n=1 Tax=Cellulomonas shaoxiangyii TaxID=2566013 RepID=A0A4P7SN52_9CELL|nr:hypothetical protein [Cellulomonas shaoxiangyii]QCB94324.1 hypothetical protein E5225_12915 [Cellulomonas shaoxiangyii]TGY82167.1 hypothetical protein E5226_13450 [Cellulomonas shaoxiangyii]
MSTVPGNDAWRDAGLVPADTDLPVELTDPDAAAGEDELVERPDPEDYAPLSPRPDLVGAAEEADVVEQAEEVPLDDEAEGE